MPAPFRPALPVLIALFLPAGLAHAQAGPRTVGSFQTPSGNIHCEQWQLEHRQAPELRCDVLAAENPPPAKPEDCELDYGSAFGLSPRGKAELLCVGDTIADPDHPRLRYGATWRGAGGITCDATAARLRCTNPAGHGFALSKRSQRRF